MAERIIIYMNPESYQRVADGDWIDRRLIAPKEILQIVTSVIFVNDLHLGGQEVVVDVKRDKELGKTQWAYRLSKEDD